MFDKYELNDKSLIADKNVEKKEIKTISTAEKKAITPTKSLKTSVTGRKPGPKSSKFYEFVIKIF